MNKQEKVQLLAFIVLVGFFFAVAFHYISNVYYDRHFPWNTFLCEPLPNFAFGDFFPLQRLGRNLDPYVMMTEWAGVYFPFNYLLFYLLGGMSERHALVPYLILFVVTMFAANKVFLLDKPAVSSRPLAERLADAKTLFVLSVLNYPFLFSFERANAECVVFLFSVLFLYSFGAKRFFLSALFLACAAAMKGYAGIFVFVFLLERRFKPAAFFCVLTAIFTFVSLLLFEGSMVNQVAILLQNLDWLKNHMLQTADGIFWFYSASLFDFLKVFGIPTTNKVMSYYAVWSGAMLAVLIAHLFVFETVLWRKVTVLTAASLILPVMSIDYHMINIFLPLYLFVNYTPKVPQPRRDLVYTVIFGLLLIPKNYFLVKKYSIAHWSESGLLVLLIALTILDAISERRALRAGAGTVDSLTKHA